jgi:hypothetical protein
MMPYGSGYIRQRTAQILYGLGSTNALVIVGDRTFSS